MTMLDVTNIEWVGGVDYDQVNEDNGFVLNGRQYEFAQFTHVERKKVCTALIKIMQNPSITPCSAEFAETESLINSKLLLDGVQVSKRDGHWERFPSDFVQCMFVSVGAISHPFFPLKKPN